ncbi:hypothetical protein AWB78_03130 [Caballeronia calidae]|uniref:Uncharacterized protein n=1 Tax=Caballeronia calidae TaxID=1777139 RepID=A0A158BUQ1_9BURK|nr:hypothetical protein AWB78_03130 [Caballeronia calidae]
MPYFKGFFIRLRCRGIFGGYVLAMSSPRFAHHHFALLNRFRMKLSPMKHFAALFRKPNSGAAFIGPTIRAQTFYGRTPSGGGSSDSLQAPCRGPHGRSRASYARTDVVSPADFSERAMGAPYSAHATPRGRFFAFLAKPRPARLRAKSSAVEYHARSLAHRAHGTQMNHFSLSLRKEVDCRRDVDL